jgi:hypothetical protein
MCGKSRICRTLVIERCEVIFDCKLRVRLGYVMLVRSSGDACRTALEPTWMRAESLDGAWQPDRPGYTKVMIRGSDVYNVMQRWHCIVFLDPLHLDLKAYVSGRNLSDYFSLTVQE